MTYPPDTVDFQGEAPLVASLGTLDIKDCSRGSEFCPNLGVGYDD